MDQFVNIKIRYKTRSPSYRESQVILAYPSNGASSLESFFDFIWMLQESQLVAQFTVSGSVMELFNWDGLEKYVKKFTYISDYNTDRSK